LQYNFEWDTEKARINRIKHGVAFEVAVQIFLDPLAISVYDEEHSVHEDRWITIGKAVGDSILVVVHGFTEQPPDECTVRVISARRATKREQIQYEG
jgi:uncharacterized DUF497 family protein